MKRTPEKVACLQCTEEGKASYVYVRSIPVTLMCSESYYDEGGNYHYHNPNNDGHMYECSHGHKMFYERKYKPCGCVSDEPGELVKAKF